MEYLVRVEMACGYFVKVKADSPEEAATKVDSMALKEIRHGEFYANTDRPGKVVAVYDLTTMEEIPMDQLK